MANPGPSVTISSNAINTGDAPDGIKLGNYSTSLVAFYGATPIVQRSNPAQAAVPTTAGSFTLFTINTVALSPVSVAANTTASQAILCTGAPTLTGDFCGINKITAQAGLGIANMRHGTTAATIVVDYVNLTASPIVPTASESYLVAALRGTIPAVTLTPAPVPANTTLEQQFSVPGLVAGASIQVSKAADQAGLGLAGCRVISNNVLGITYINATAATITPTAAESYSFFSGSGFDPSGNDFLVGANVGTLTGVATITTAEQNVTVTGAFAANDFIIGVSKPTHQAGLGIINARVSAVNVLSIGFVNPTAATVTPTANEIYTVQVYRPNLPAVAVLLPVALTPASVAANTTAEQTFTVTGLPAGSFSYVNKPSFQPGLGIVGFRTSAANTIAITYANATASAIVPTAETYLVTGISLMPSAGSYIAQSISPGGISTLALVNELRQSMVNIGLILGS